MSDLLRGTWSNSFFFEINKDERFLEHMSHLKISKNGLFLCLKFTVFTVWLFLFFTQVKSQRSQKRIGGATGGEGGQLAPTKKVCSHLIPQFLSQY